MATAHQAASGIRKWALTKNLLATLSMEVEALYVADVQPAVFPEAAENILRQRGMTSIAYSDSQSTVFVYTKKRLTQKDIASLPDEIFGCDVLYAQGDVDELDDTPKHTQGAPYALVPNPAGARYCCGSSISPGNVAAAGTLGALVMDKDGDLFGLTNNHVTGACSHSAIGLPILAPGVLDVMAGSILPFTIGLHEAVLDMIPGVGGNVDILRNTDAAIFRIDNLDKVSSYQGSAFDTPTAIVDPQDGMIVEKVGRTTGHTIGRIVGRELIPLSVSTSAPTYGFQARILFPEVFIVHGDESTFSDGGDSGSLVVTRQLDGTLAAVGLLFAGGPDSRAPGHIRTFILPIRPIMEGFGVTLVSGHNVP